MISRRHFDVNIITTPALLHYFQHLYIRMQLLRITTSIRSCLINRSSLPNLFKNAIYSQSCKRPDIVKNMSTQQVYWKVNTAPVKDVLLYRYDNTKFFQILSLFSVSQLIFWLYCAEFSMSALKDSPVKTENAGDLPWYRRVNLGENKYRNGIVTLCFLVGTGILAGTWFYSLRAVRYLVLRKGGKTVSVVTYAPFARTRIMEVPLSHVSSTQTREVARVQLPFKVKGRVGHFLLDMRGEFTNGPLFDATVGLKRIFT